MAVTDTGPAVPPPRRAKLPPLPFQLGNMGALAIAVDHLDVVYTVVGARAPTTPTGRHSTGGLGRRLTRRLLLRGDQGSVTTTKVHAVKDLSFVAKHGESIGVIGVNGSGKSTLLKAIAGLVPVANGTVYAGGEPSLLGVNAALLWDLTGEENIIIGGLALGLSNAEIRSRVPEIADFAGLGDFIHLPLRTYSSGMAARLRFAISTAVQPDILMIDEALATGDAEFRARSQERIDEIRSQAATVVLVAHSMSTIKEMCSRVLWINGGHLIADGDPDEVCDAYMEYIKLLKAERQKTQQG
jgi:teichoic acid transport system ATP-binding protein